MLVQSCHLMKQAIFCKCNHMTPPSFALPLLKWSTELKNWLGSNSSLACSTVLVVVYWNINRTRIVVVRCVTSMVVDMESSSEITTIMFG